MELMPCALTTEDFVHHFLDRRMATIVSKYASQDGGRWEPVKLDPVKPHTTTQAPSLGTTNEGDWPNLKVLSAAVASMLIPRRRPVLQR